MNVVCINVRHMNAELNFPMKGLITHGLMAKSEWLNISLLEFGPNLGFHSIGTKTKTQD